MVEFFLNFKTFKFDIGTEAGKESERRCDGFAEFVRCESAT